MSKGKKRVGGLSLQRKQHAKSGRKGALRGRGSIPGAQALSRGLSLLELVFSAPKPMRFSELQQYSGLPKGTLHRILQPLIDGGLIKFDARAEVYLLGNRIFEMAHKVWNQFDLRGAAEPELERLVSLSQETARIGVLDGSNALLIDQRESRQPVRLGQGVGSGLAATASALGKALLAYQTPEAFSRILQEWRRQQITPNTIVDAAKLQKDLDLGKARGYFIDLEEENIGINAVAAPILNHRNEALGAIGIAGPSFRLPLDLLHTLGREVFESARRVSGNVGETSMSISTTPIPSIGTSDKLSCVVPASAFLGEGPCWMAGSNTLLWVDILGPTVNVSNVVSGETRSLSISEIVGVVVPRKRGGFVAATQAGFRALDLTTGNMTTLATPKAMSGRRFNDGKCDPAGRFWAGTIALDATPDKGTLYRLDPDGTLTEMEQGLYISNGMGWSPDNKIFYLVDSGRRAIYRYDYDLETGNISNKRTLVSFEEHDGMPDGLAIDVEGYLWCAMWDGWSIKRLTPDGRLDRSVELPVPRPTSCAFGGDDMNTLFITSARIRLSAMQLAAAPMSGSVFSLRTDVPGLAVASFGG